MFVLITPLVSLALAASLQAPDPVRYEVRIPDRAHHEAEITVTWTGIPRGQTLEARMSRSSPGRYALHEFAKNVYRVRAEDGSGKALPVTQANPHQWDVTGHDGTVRMHYTLFGDRADGTYSQIDVTHAHLNIPATFLWARGTHERPVEVRFHDLPERWKVHTQLQPTADPLVWRARDFQYFMDSPIEVTEADVREWKVAGAGGDSLAIRLAVHHHGLTSDVDLFVEAVQKVVREQGAIYGEFPAFDHGTYTFLADYVPHASGDGMEHRNSTVVSSNASIATNPLGLLGTVSHEFFHAWNVERIRPRSLEPFDFERENMSGELWLAEGFTSYYGPLAIRRAGLLDDAAYARRLSNAVNTVTNAPGRQFFSPRGMSMQAPFVDAATSIDPQNKPNTFISYYTWGEGLGLALDLTLRSRPGGKTLDDFMRELWRTHGKTEQPYTPEDVEEALARASGDAAFARDFIARFVEGRESPDYTTLLGQAGFLVRVADDTAAWMGDMAMRPVEGGGLVLTGPTLIPWPLHAAGLDRGDVISMIDGKPMNGPEDVLAVLNAHQAGDAVGISWVSRGTPQSGTLTFRADPRVEVVAVETVGGEVTPSMKAFREAWLSSRVP